MTPRRALPLLALLPNAVRAQAAFPDRPIRFIVPFAAGGMVTSRRGSLVRASQPASASRWWWKTAPAPRAPSAPRR